MLQQSHSLTLPSSSQMSFQGNPPRPAAATGTGARAPPDILTYSYAARMVYVTPGESYDHAIDIAKESFVELRDVDRERITLEVHVVLKNQQGRRAAEIGRSAWNVVVPSLARFEIVEIRVTPPPPGPKAAAALSGSQAPSISEPPPYASEKGSTLYPDSQSNFTAYRPQSTSSQSSSSSFANRVVDLLTPKSSRSRLSPQPYHQY